MSGIRPYMPCEINIACILFKQGSIVKPDVSPLVLNLIDLRNYYHIFTFYPIGVCVCVCGGGGGGRGKRLFGGIFRKSVQKLHNLESVVHPIVYFRFDGQLTRLNRPYLTAGSPKYCFSVI